MHAAMATYTAVIRREEDMFVATCPEIGTASQGKSVDEAMTLKNTDIVEKLHLPPVKIHCSVLAEDAIKAAIEDYKNRNGG